MREWKAAGKQETQLMDDPGNYLRTFPCSLLLSAGARSLRAILFAPLFPVYSFLLLLIFFYSFAILSFIVSSLGVISALPVRPRGQDG